MRIRTEINEIETESIENINDTESYFFNKIDKPLAI